MDAESTWIYTEISNEIYDEYRKQYSFIKGVNFFGRKVNGDLFLLWIGLAIACGLVQTIYCFGSIQVTIAVIFIFIYYIGLCISMRKFKVLQYVHNYRFFAKLEYVLKKYNITKNDYERYLLESEKVI